MNKTVPFPGFSSIMQQNVLLPVRKLSSKVNVRLEAIPASIEAYLEEAGFSGTELIVLKKLLEEDALTLRELAGKTGKSTGVLDQAIKKLVKKSIVARETINDTPKYTLRSLQTIVDWMNDDIAIKQEMLKRKHENFESFVRSLTIGKKRPEMEYFEGVSGLKKAYMTLLERGNDIVQYGPIVYAANEDPFNAFWVDYFRQRRSKGIFARVITHNNPLGRRYQSRDPFEYRKTILVDPEAYPFHFEKIIIGDTVACFQLEDERACFIKYPELAQSERAFFEKLWNKKVESSRQESAHAQAAEKFEKPVTVVPPLHTRTLSQLREFFLSRKSIALMAVFGLLSAGITYGLYRQNLALNLVRIQERVKSIAATGALQFDPADLHELRTPEDITKPQYKKVIYQLNEIRRQNDGVKYAYILRPFSDPRNWQFIADADSLEPYTKKDLNGDSIIDEADHLSPPGENIDITDADSFLRAYNSKSTAFDHAPYTDQWGTFISGAAPIMDDKLNVVAVLGIDINAKTLNDLSERTFAPPLYFIGFFLLFLFIRLAAFNRSIMKEILQLLQLKKVMIISGTCAFIAILITFGLYQYTKQLTLKRMQDKVLAVAVTAAPQFNAEDVHALRIEEDWQKPEWSKVVGQLKQIKEDNDLLYAYIFRKTAGNAEKMEFVADADSLYPYANTDDNPFNDVDQYNDGAIDGSLGGGDLLAWPGQPYPSAPAEAFDSYNGARTNKDFYEDQWGKVLTGYAPIFNDNNEVVAILAVDLKAKRQTSLASEVFAPVYVFTTFFIILVLTRASAFLKRRR